MENKLLWLGWMVIICQFMTLWLKGFHILLWNLSLMGLAMSCIWLNKLGDK
jgi:hypothetical protein